MRLGEVRQVLSERLLAHDPAPVAVAVSGGGDSLALLLAAHGWAQANGRNLLALTLDHGLQPQSASWATQVAARAARLGVPAEILTWEGEKPRKGLPAAARLARHALLASAARAAGARVLLMGHTADDVLEARAMRAAGASTREPRVWSPSPAWPEGRGLFLLRPLLGERRTAIRAWLAGEGETWIDDPANGDLRYGRARARAELAQGIPALADPPAEVDARELAAACTSDAAGGLRLSRARLRTAEPAAALRFLSAACLCAAGSNRPPRGERLRRLAELAWRREPFVATLAGARVEGDAEGLSFTREAGEAARGGLAPAPLDPGRTIVWDGRFELTARRAGLSVRALAGRATHLSPAERRALAVLPAASRPGLPLLIDADGATRAPVLDPTLDVAVAALPLPRLHAACGLVEREPAS